MHLQNNFFPLGYDPKSAFPRNDWNEVKRVFKNEESIKIGFLKTLIKATELLPDTKHTLYLCDELVEGENDYEAMRSWIEFEMDLLKNLENEGFIKNQRIVKKQILERHENQVYVSYELTTKDLRKRLSELLQQNQKIVEKRKAEAKKKRDIKYQITYAEENIILNGKYLLHSNDFDSSNDRLFSYACNNSGTKIGVDDIESYAKALFPPKTQLKHVVNNLGFKDELKKLFFKVSGDTFIFFNHITAHDLKERGIDVKELEAQIKGLEKVGKK